MIKGSVLTSDLTQCNPQLLYYFTKDLSLFFFLSSFYVFLQWYVETVGGSVSLPKEREDHTGFNNKEVSD